MIGIFYKNLFHGRREMLPSFRTTTTTAAEMIPHRWLWKEFWLREVGRHKRVLPGLCDLMSIMQAQTKKTFNCEAAGEKKALKKHTNDNESFTNCPRRFYAFHHDHRTSVCNFSWATKCLWNGKWNNFHVFDRHRANEASSRVMK